MPCSESSSTRRAPCWDVRACESGLLPSRRTSGVCDTRSWGDAHEIVVDLVTGITLAVTSVMDGIEFHHDEVTDLEIDAPVASLR